MTSNKKQDLIDACNHYVGERIDRIRHAISDLEDALKLETKCSMGDKYETGRAMLHLEFEKLSGQLEQYGQLKKTVDLIRNIQPSEVISFGSVVETSGANYILAIPAGKFTVHDKNCLCKISRKIRFTPSPKGSLIFLDSPFRVGV